MGGGTPHAVSFSIDIRVCRSILIGLKVISRLVKGEMKLSTLVEEGMKQAPLGTRDMVDTYRLNPERIAMFDRDLRPFRKGYIGGGAEQQVEAMDDPSRARVVATEPEDLTEDHHYGTEVTHIPPDATEVTLLRFPGAARAFAAYGWAPMESVAEAQRYGASDARFRPDLVEMYKYILGMARHAYNPVFFLTNLEAMAHIDEEQLATLVADVPDNTWLCIDPRSAEKLGVRAPINPETGRELNLGSYGHDWSRSCQQHIDDLRRGRDWEYRGYLPSGFEPPDPEDTVAYLGSGMSELRVFNPELIYDVRLHETLGDAEWDVNPDDPDSVIVYPEFRARGN